MYLKCEGGGAERWPLPTGRELEGASCRASRRRMTRMRTRARTEKAKAAVPKVTPVAGRQENTLSNLLLLPSAFVASHTSALTSCLTNLKLLVVKFDLLVLEEVATERYPNILFAHVMCVGIKSIWKLRSAAAEMLLPSPAVEVLWLLDPPEPSVGCSDLCSHSK